MKLRITELIEGNGLFTETTLDMQHIVQKPPRA